MLPPGGLAVETARRWGAGGSLTRRALPGPPLSSFGHGAAGVAYFLLRYGALRDDARWTTAAGDWWVRAEHDLLEPGACVGEPPVFPDTGAAGPASLYFGEAGVWCAGTLVAQAHHDRDGVERCVERFAVLADSCPADRPDVVSGAAGLLLGAAAMADELDNPAPARLAAAGGRLADWLTRLAARPAQLSEPVGWLGAAHGWCGIAHALLRWCQATGSIPGTEVRALLAALRDTRLPSGLWPRRASSDEVWPGWCHGSVGWTQLWTLAADVLGNGEALTMAEQTGIHAVDAALDAGAGLCCGGAGASYAALALYRSTGDGTWLVRARRLAAQLAPAVPGRDLPEQSLWRGQLGVALLLAELDEPSSAAMPLYRQGSVADH